MENQKDMAPQDQTNQDETSSEPQVETLNPDAVKPSSEGTNNAITDTEDGDILSSLAKHSAQIANLSTALEQQRVALQNAEVQLVTRIADVDDDRRLAAHRLQRAWQSHRDEMDDNLKRRGSTLAGILLLFGILVAISLAYFYAKFDQTRQTLVGDVADLRHAIDQLQIQIPDSVTQNQQTQDKLSHLSLAIKSIPTSLESPNDLPAGTEATHGKEPSIREPDPLVAQEEPTGDTTSHDTSQFKQNVSVTDAKDPSSETIKTEAPSTLENVTPEELSPALDSAPAKDDRRPTETGEPAIDNITSGEPETSADPERIHVGDAPFTLQLVGFYSLEDLQRFARRFTLPSEVYYQEETYQGRPWFVLIHSLHESRESANAAISKLPAELAKLDLWVRKLEPNSTVTLLKTTSN